MRAARACNGRNYTVFYESDCQHRQIPKTKCRYCSAIFTRLLAYLYALFFHKVFPLELPAAGPCMVTVFPPPSSPLSPFVTCLEMYQVLLTWYTLSLSHEGFGRRHASSKKANSSRSRFPPEKRHRNNPRLESNLPSSSNRVDHHAFVDWATQLTYSNASLAHF